MILFTVDMIPVAKGRPRFFTRGKYQGTYTPLKTRNAEKEFILQTAKYRPDKPIETAIEMNLIFGMPLPKNRKTKYPMNKPDVDNMAKLILDCMNKVFYKDDSQIVSLTAKKEYAEKPFISVEITEVK